MDTVLSKALREFTTGPLNQLIVNLAGEDGQSWETAFKQFLRKEPCWCKDPQTYAGALLDFVKPVPAGTTLTGHEFVAEAKKLAMEKGQQTLGQADYDFYKKRENWHLLPADKSVVVVVFCDAQFGSGDDRRVRCLYRFGALWREVGLWLGLDFDGGCVAAVSQVGSKTLET